MLNFSQLEVDLVPKETAKDICIRNHYSHKWQFSFGTRNYGIFQNGELLGVAVYGNPMNPKSWPSITKTDPAKCIELNRLWIDDKLGKNTESWFLSQTFQRLRDDGFLLIQSFADGRLGVGTIYQATNFGFYGSHKTLFQELDSGEILHNGKFSDTSSPRTMVARNILLAEGRVKAFEVSTYRYLYGLSKKAKKDILLKQQPYPKERLGIVELPDLQPPASQVARAAAIALYLNLLDEHNKLMAYLATLTNQPNQLIEEAFENPMIAKLKQQADEEPLF